MELEHSQSVKETLSRYYELDPQAGSLSPQEHPNLVLAAEWALAQAEAIETEKIRQYTARQADLQDFYLYARGAYGLAARLPRHDLCAQAARLLVVWCERRKLKRLKEFWSLAQAVHITHTYPRVKFDSTFDIIVTQTVFSVRLPADDEDLAMIEFIHQVCDLIDHHVGEQSLEELVKFISLPHDIYSTAVSLIYIAHLHLRGLDGNRALPVIQDLAHKPPDAQLVAAAACLPAYVIETCPHDLALQTPGQEKLAGLAAALALPGETLPAQDYRALVDTATAAIFARWPQGFNGRDR